MASDRRHRSRRATCSSTERTRAPRRSTTRTRRSRGVRHRPPGPDLEAGLGLRKFRDSLQTPPLIRAWRGQRPVRVRAQVTEVQLHADLPAVPGWGYNGSVPGPTIEVRRGRPTLIDWENGLGTITAPETLPFDVVRVPLLSSGAPDFLRANSPGGCSTSRGCGADAYPPSARLRRVGRRDDRPSARRPDQRASAPSRGVVLGSASGASASGARHRGSSRRQLGARIPRGGWLASCLADWVGRKGCSDTPLVGPFSQRLLPRPCVADWV